MSDERDDAAVIRMLNMAAREWTRHVLGECDPDECPGDHEPPWRPAEERNQR